MKKSLFLAVVFLQGCASATTTYMGNGLYEIDSSGAPAAGDAKVSRLLFAEAFKTCAKSGQGFVVVSMADTSHSSLHANSSTSGYGNAQGYRGYAQAQYASNTQSGAYTMHHPGRRAVTKCEGPIDAQMQAEYGERMPASK